MKFKIGFAAGFAAGYWVATTTNEERRARFDDAVARVRANPTVRQISDTVSRDARKVGEALQQRFVETADRTSDAVADKVEPSSEVATKAS
jgi:hypothetical protein